MTRGAMKTRIAQLLGLSIGDGVYGDPFAIDNALNRVTDEFAGPGMDCYWTTETGDITADVAEYAAPTMYKLTGALYLDDAGKWRPLSPISSGAMDRLSLDWRNTSSTANPVFIVFEGSGVNRFLLSPTPNFDRAGGLKFEGYANTNASGISTWAANSSECPLPSWAHEAIVYGAAVDLAGLMLASDDPREAGKASRVLSILDRRYRQLRGHAEGAAATYFQDVVKSSLGSNWLGWLYSR